MKFLSLTIVLACIPLALSAALHLKTGAITVDDNGTKLAYTDSGAPHLPPYTTVFAVHGQGFNSGIFERVQAAARSSLRFVAVNRRGYAGSTLYSSEEIRIVNNGTEAEKTSFHAARGLELVAFMDKFIQQEHISLKTSSHSHQDNGIALVGWSLGNSVTVSAVANIHSASAETRARLGPYIRTLILHEPSSNILGLPVDPRNWVPWTIIDPTIVKSNQLPLFAEFVAGYFQHGDLSTRNPDVLSFQAHSFSLRPPSVYSMFAAGRGSIIDAPDTVELEMTYQINFGPQLLASYQALYSQDLPVTLPNMKTFFFGGENSPSYGPFTTWAIQNDDAAHGGGFIKAKLLSGINHMCAWDDPELTLRTYQDCIARVF